MSMVVMNALRRDASVCGSWQRGEALFEKTYPVDLVMGCCVNLE